MGEYFLNLEKPWGSIPTPVKGENVFLKTGKKKGGAKKDSGLYTSKFSFTAQTTKGKKRSNSCVFLSVQSWLSLGTFPWRRLAMVTATHRC